MAKPELLELRVHAAADPERLAIACVTFAELDARANRLADVLRALGLQRGDHLASLPPSRVPASALPWAAWRSGVCLTPMSTSLVASRLAYPRRAVPGAPDGQRCQWCGADGGRGAGSDRRVAAAQRVAVACLGASRSSGMPAFSHSGSPPRNQYTWRKPAVNAALVAL